MEKWQIENSETSEISEMLFWVFLFSGFRKLGLQISEKNFRVFRVFDLAILFVTKINFSYITIRSR